MEKTTIIFILLLTSIENVLCQTRTQWPDSLMNETIEISKGLMNNIGNSLPTFNEILNASKQWIFGWSSKFLFDILSGICSIAIKFNTLKPENPTEITGVNIQLRTKCENFAYPILGAEDLMKNEHFNRSKKIIILTTGWRTQPNISDITKTMQKAFLCRDDVNFLIYDAANYIDDVPYTSAAYNVNSVGYYLSLFLSDLLKEIPIENIHLIGFSLGAHIMGHASYWLEFSQNKKIKRITGLDPARPCFNNGDEFYSLTREQAEFVDIIHSNPGVFGQMEALGHADFYTNGFDPLVPGCFDYQCSHDRAWMYYAESVYPENGNNFPATRCASLYDVLHGYCTGKTIPMGYATPIEDIGNLFVKVKSFSPFGENADERREKMYENCGLCEMEQR